MLSSFNSSYASLRSKNFSMRISFESPSTIFRSSCLVFLLLRICFEAEKGHTSLDIGLTTMYFHTALFRVRAMLACNAVVTLIIIDLFYNCNIKKSVKFSLWLTTFDTGLTVRGTDCISHVWLLSYLLAVFCVGLIMNDCIYQVQVQSLDTSLDITYVNS